VFAHRGNIQRLTRAGNGVADLRTMKQIAVIGAGSWGTALAVVAARAGHNVRLWSRNSAVVSSINEQRVNSAI
jgi:pyruvate/2-oxoglutarate dehydrogenase complex dihydrolipoamide dehydrogenase (E3) component